MITKIDKPFERRDLETKLNWLIKEWFFKKFKDFSLPQLYGVLPIMGRKNILISAPTGGTKTLTAFLAILNYLVELALKKELEDKVYAVYVSPLKALNNDIAVNLKEPLKEINILAKEKGVEIQEIRVGLRTGDIGAYEKSKMLKKTPHILITTPESLAIVLCSKRFVEKLNFVEFLIVDEIHALANKRGVHLSISLERLSENSIIDPVRIGLSATISPLEEIANFLVGDGRDCLIADIQFSKKFEIKILSPSKDLINIEAGKLHKNLYELIDGLIQKHKTTLIFTNTRSGTERVVNHLKEKFPTRYGEFIGAHHSSLSKEHRFDIEKKLREGKLKVVVTSTSLELGIDIGYIDLVILLGSPKSIARAMQRIGRAGHRLHEVAKGRIIVLDRDDLIECCVLTKKAIEGKIDMITIPKNCLDVLAQQIFGMAIQKVWNVDDMLNTIRRSYCYKKISAEDFFSVVYYLAGEYELEHKNVYAKIWYDPEKKQIGKKGKMARMIYMTNVGTIPDESFVNVEVAIPNERKGQTVGKIDEAFLERLKKGDVFVLGGNKYEFLYSRGMKAYVKAGIARNPTIPSWVSETLPLNFDLALEIQRFRKLMDEKFRMGKEKFEIKKFIREYLHSDEDSTEAIYEYFNEQYKFAKIPHEERIVIEHFHDKGKYYVVFHSLFGRRVNDTLSRVIGYLVGRTKNRDIEIGINDNGFYLASLEKINLDKVLNYIKIDNFREIAEISIENTELFSRRFRHCATRGLMILRNYKGRNKTVGKQQMNSFFLLNATRRISKNFPIIKETKREILEDFMDIENTLVVLKGISQEKIKIEQINTNIPSPFSWNLIMQGYSDLIKIEDRLEFLKRMHEKLVEKIR